MSEENKICPVSGLPCDKNKCYPINEIVDGLTKNIKLCEDCVQQYLHRPETLKEIKGETPGKNIVTKNKLVDFCKKIGIPTSPKSNIEIKKCSKCGYTLLELKEMGKLQCDMCFESFIEEIENYMYTTYGIPKDKQPKKHKLNELNDLKEKLKVLIKEENFEEASVFNNKIKELKSKLIKIKNIRQEIKFLIESGKYKEAELLKTKLKEIN